MTAGERAAFIAEIRNDIERYIEGQLAGHRAGHAPTASVTLAPQTDPTTGLALTQGFLFGQSSTAPLATQSPPGFVYDPTAADPMVKLRRWDGATANQVVSTNDAVNEPVNLTGSPALLVADQSLIANLNAEFVGGFAGSELMALASRPRLAAFGYVNPRSPFVAVTNAYGVAAHSIPWNLPGEDVLGATVSAVALIIRYTAIASAGTFSLRVRDRTTTEDVAEITAIAAGTSLIASGVGENWPDDSTKDIEIEVLHTTGVAGNSFTLQNLTLVAVL
mgnify:CR=1 FL=1